MHLYTYKITNLINGKIYIGVHKTKNLDDGYMGSGSILTKAKRKYGIENFHKDILMFHDTEDDMFEIEALIVDSEFIKRKDVYNVKIGGQGGWDYINTNSSLVKSRNTNASKKFKEKILTDSSFKAEFSAKCKERIKRVGVSESFKNSMSFKGKSHTLETKEKMSLAAKTRTGEKNNQFGKMWIHSISEQRSIRIDKESQIPEGWSKGRKMFK